MPQATPARGRHKEEMCVLNDQGPCKKGGGGCERVSELSTETPKFRYFGGSGDFLKIPRYRLSES